MWTARWFDSTISHAWTRHALDKMVDDDLDELDCRNVIWNGEGGGCDAEGPRGEVLRM